MNPSADFLAVDRIGSTGLQSWGQDLGVERYREAGSSGKETGRWDSVKGAEEEVRLNVWGQILADGGHCRHREALLLLGKSRTELLFLDIIPIPYNLPF